MEEVVKAGEGELSRHGRLPAKAQSGEPAGQFALRQPGCLRRLLNLKPGSLVMRKTSFSSLTVRPPFVYYGARATDRRSLS